MNKNNYFKKIRKVYALTKKYIPLNPYHNLRHTKDVFYTISKLSRLEGICKEDKFVLQTAALLHDVIFKIGAKDNEEKSAEFAMKYLPKVGYPLCQTQKVYDLILATKMPTKPRNKLEKIICDADVDNLGRQDFFERGDEVRQELGIYNNKTWYEVQLKLLKNHSYYTISANNLRNVSLKANIRRIEKILRRYEKC